MLTLIRRHSALVAATARRMTNNAEDAEDVFQSTFLVLIRSAHKIKKRSSLSSWLYGVCYRIAWQLRRQKKNRKEISISSESKNDTPSLEAVSMDDQTQTDPLTQLARQMEVVQLDQELHQLPQWARGVLIDHYIRGRTAKQIAEHMELSVSAVEGRLKRGRHLLRSRLARRGIAFSAAVAAANWFQSKVSSAAEVSAEYSSQVWAEKLCDQLADEPNWHSFSNKNSIESFVQGELVMKKSTVIKSTLIMCAVGSLTDLLGAVAIAQLGGLGTAQQDAEISSLPQTPSSDEGVVVGESAPTTNTQENPQITPNDNDLLSTFQLQNIPSDYALTVLETITPVNPNVRIDSLRTSNSILVKADLKSLQQIEKILNLIDKPAARQSGQGQQMERNEQPSVVAGTGLANTGLANTEPWSATAPWEKRGVNRSAAIERADSLLSETVSLKPGNKPIRYVLENISATSNSR